MFISLLIVLMHILHKQLISRNKSIFILTVCFCLHHDPDNSLNHLWQSEQSGVALSLSRHRRQEPEGGTREHDPSELFLSNPTS